MTTVANLWGWTIASATGLAIVYGFDLTSEPVYLRRLSMTENIIYGGFHRLAWAIAVSWVIFACSRGYGGLLILLSFKMLTKVTFFSESLRLDQSVPKLECFCTFEQNFIYHVFVAYQC